MGWFFGGWASPTFAQQLQPCASIHANEVIENISIDDQQVKRVLTKNSGLLKFQNCDALANIDEEYATFYRSEAFKDIHIESLLYDKEFIWIGTLGHGLLILYRDTRKPILSGSLLAKCVQDINHTITEVYKICTQNKGSNQVKWLVTDRGIYTITNNKKLRQERGFRGKHFTSIAINNGIAWASASDGTIWQRTVRDLDVGMQWLKISAIEAQLVGFTKDLAFDQDGRLWIAGRHLIRYNPVNQEVKVFDEKLGFRSQQATSILIEKNNKIWVGTDRGGLFTATNDRFDNRSIEVLKVQKYRSNKLKISLKLQRVLTSEEYQKLRFELTYNRSSPQLLAMKHVNEVRPQLPTTTRWLTKIFMLPKGQDFWLGKFTLTIFIGDDPVGKIKGSI